MRRLSPALLAALAAVALPAWAQAPPDSSARAPREMGGELGRISVTATRAARDLESVPVPVTVVTEAEIREQGALRVSDVLEAVPGLFLSDDHGTGVRVQGFDPDYTLVLVDGAPVVGRTAGTLDLDRLSVAGLDRVEVVRGPSSSLYGSEALAGVVNLVTALPRAGRDGRPAAGGETRLRVGSFGATDALVQAGVGADRWAARALVQRFGSRGYDLTPDTFGPTAPAFADVTADVRARADVGPAALRLGVRAAVQDQAGAFALPAPGGAETRYDDAGRRVDWSVHPELAVPLGRRLRLTATLYGARYTAATRQTEAATGAAYFTDDFDQRFGRAEGQLDATWSARHLSVAGVGAQAERLAGDRYGAGAAPRATQLYAFAQHDWQATPSVWLNASVRADAHSAYAARLTPKLAALVRPARGVRLRASAGSGFKAPDFRQLFLAFSNPAAGYSVFGSERLADGVAGLQAAGALAQTFLDPAALGAIRAESAWSYQAGVALDPAPWLALDANAFWNEVRDLIETQPVAQKTNGQFVYGYFNLNRVYTRGVTLAATVRPAPGLEATASYERLQARDRAVVDALGAGTVYGRDPDGREYRLTLADYGGLFGRSPHSATLRARYAAGPWSASARARWRSRYGYRDLDGNGVANRDGEFVPATALVDLTATRIVALGGRTLTVQAGADNLFGVTRGLLVPSLPGRTLFASVGLQF